MPYTPPKAEALRTFVVLDSEAVLSGLSALDGGAVDEILTRTSEDAGSQLSGHVGGRAAKASGGRNRQRKVEEELRRRRTEHSAAAALIDGLTEREAIGEVEGQLDEEVAAALTPGSTIRVRGDVVLHPLHQVDAMLRSFVGAAAAFDQQETAKELRKVLPTWEALIGSGSTSRVMFDLVTGSQQIPRVLIPAPRRALQVDVAEVGGFSTVLAKVERIVGPDEQVLALRVLQNAPQSDMERQAVAEAAVSLIEGVAEIGVSATRDDVVMPGPLVMLRPLCIWR